MTDPDEKERNSLFWFGLIVGPVFLYILLSPIYVSGVINLGESFPPSNEWPLWGWAAYWLTVASLTLQTVKSLIVAFFRLAGKSKDDSFSLAEQAEDKMATVIGLSIAGLILLAYVSWIATKLHEVSLTERLQSDDFRWTIVICLLAYIAVRISIKNR